MTGTDYKKLQNGSDIRGVSTEGYPGEIPNLTVKEATNEPNKIIMIGVSTMTNNGLSACQISGAIFSESTKSRAKTESDCPFWWNSVDRKSVV